jgi:hypothetical protein
MRQSNHACFMATSFGQERHMAGEQRVGGILGLNQSFAFMA